MTSLDGSRPLRYEQDVLEVARAFFDNDRSGRLVPEMKGAAEHPHPHDVAFETRLRDLAVRLDRRERAGYRKTILRAVTSGVP